MQVEYDISIITVNYNGLEDTSELIASIPFDQYSIEMIVVDNASTLDEASIIQSRYPHVITIRNNKNLGFAGGNNVGIRAAHGKYLFLINNDTVFEECNLQGLISRLDTNPKIAIVCPKIRYAFGNKLIQFAGYTPLSRYTVRNHAIGCGEQDHGQYNIAHATPYAHGAAMMIRREAIKKVGLMSDEFFLYYEELDWSMRISEAGYEIWYDPSCTVYHKESQTTGQNSPLRTFYITRNRLLLVRRNWYAPSKYISYIYLMALVAIKDLLKYTITGHLALFLATIRGLWSFIKM